MMHLAMYDAVNLIDGSPHSPFLPNLACVSVPAGASKEAAAAYAANHILNAINEVYKTVPGYTAFAALKTLYDTAITTFEALFPGSAQSRAPSPTKRRSGSTPRWPVARSVGPSRAPRT